MVIKGDEHAFRLLIVKYQDHIYKSVYAVLRNQKDAEDASQEVFIKMFYALPQYHFQGFKTWMTRIAVNHAIDMKRKKERNQAQSIDAIEFEFVASSDNTEDLVVKKELQEKVIRRIHELPSNYQEVVYAYYIAEKSYKEIALDQKVEVTTVKMKLYRARSWMKKYWKEADFR